MQQLIRISMGVVMGVGLLACGACGHKSAEPEHRTIEGEAQSIDAASNQVAMRWYNPKKQGYQEVKGTVTDQTEILINGRVGRLEDIKIGEKVKVTGRIMKETGVPQLIATRIEVTREPSSASAPTTRPAER